MSYLWTVPKFHGGNNLKRVISSLVVLPPLIILLVYASKGWFFLLLLIINILALREFFGLPTFSDDKWFKTLNIAFGSLILLATYFGGMSGLSGFFLLALLALFLFSIYNLNDLNALPRLGVAVLGIVYISCLLSYFILIRESDFGALLILFLLTVVWSTDTSAYYVGKNFGKTKLLHHVSPNKTVEGAIGGLAGGVIASVLFKIFFFDTLSFFDALFLPLILSVTGQMGDLFESFVKRWAGVKDMGSLIPGHGGMLDRIDGLLFAAPVLYFYSL